MCLGITKQSKFKFSFINAKKNAVLLENLTIFFVNYYLFRPSFNYYIYLKLYFYLICFKYY